MTDGVCQAQEILDYDDLFSDEFTLEDFDVTEDYLNPQENANPMEQEEPVLSPEVPILSPHQPEPPYDPTNNDTLVINGQNPSQRPRAHMPSKPVVPMPVKQSKQQPSRAGFNKMGKKRGSYNCGKCGQPKKGHTCVDTAPDTPSHRDLSPYNVTARSQSDSPSCNTPMQRNHGTERSNSCRSLRMDDNVGGSDNNNNDNANNKTRLLPHESPLGYQGIVHTPQTSSARGTKRSLSMVEGIRPCASRANKVAKIGLCKGSSPSSSISSYSSNGRHERPMDFDADVDSVDSICDQTGSSKLSAACMVEVLKRLPPSSLLAASNVCSQWRQCARHVWSAVRETRLLVAHAGQGYIPAILKKCPNLMHLTLDVRSEIDDTLMNFIALSTPCLASLEIHISEGGINRVTGVGFNRFVEECKTLSSLKLEGCTSIRSLHISSAHLATLWLADCYSINSTVINCPVLTELSLDFVPQADDSTDLCNMIEKLGQSCPRLSKLHVASPRLNHFAVLALASANFRFLFMLSFTFGSEITDDSVAAVATSCYNLQLLDLSGSSITDKGLGIICNAFSRTLSKLLIATCPNISAAGLQTVASQLPFLQLLDCGMTMRHKCCDNGNGDSNSVQIHEESGTVQSLQGKNLSSNEHRVSNELVIRHMKLKKLSLWGCSGIHALCLDCPELVDLNINSCSNLNPGSMLLQCPNLEAVHAAYCEEVLIQAIQSQVNCTFQHETLHFSTKRMADGSKRVQAPRFGIIQQCDDRQENKKVNSSRPHSQCLVHTT
eukprot:Gb_31219 [translate_table: standard]